jgi:thiamine biosynthesis lipoprotein
MNRRDFFHSEQLFQVAAELVSAVSDSPTDAPQDFALLRASRRAMATTFEVLLPYGTRGSLAAAEAALDEVDRLEQQLSVYRETSEVSRLNRIASSAAVPVEESLFELLTLAAHISEETAGAHDITAGALIKAWGFYRGPRRVPSENELTEVLRRVGMRHVVLDPEQRSVRFLIPGLEINLGSIGKGYALDRAARILTREWNVAAALLHGGHSSVYAIGTEPGGTRGWTVGIQHPWKPGQRLAKVRLYNKALATSAITFQHLEHNGRKLGHILDPRTGWPAEGMASVTVVAATAAQADALATAFFTMGLEKTRLYCEQHADVGAVLLAQDASAPAVFGLNDNEVSLASE